MKIAHLLLLLALLPTAGFCEPSDFSRKEAVSIAWKAFEKEHFNKENFSFEKADYLEKVHQLTPDGIERSSKKNPKTAKFLRGLREEFGDGPAWRVVFQRSRNLDKSGNWYDLQNSAIVCLVFDRRRAAILDFRFREHPSDKVEPNLKAEPNGADQSRPALESEPSHTPSNRSQECRSSLSAGTG